MSPGKRGGYVAAGIAAIGLLLLILSVLGSGNEPSDSRKKASFGHDFSASGLSIAHCEDGRIKYRVKIGRIRSVDRKAGFFHVGGLKTLFLQDVHLDVYEHDASDAALKKNQVVKVRQGKANPPKKRGKKSRGVNLQALCPIKGVSGLKGANLNIDLFYKKHKVLNLKAPFFVSGPDGGLVFEEGVSLKRGKVKKKFSSSRLDMKTWTLLINEGQRIMPLFNPGSRRKPGRAAQEKQQSPMFRP